MATDHPNPAKPDSFMENVTPSYMSACGEPSAPFKNQALIPIGILLLPSMGGSPVTLKVIADGKEEDLENIVIELDLDSIDPGGCKCLLQRDKITGNITKQWVLRYTPAQVQSTPKDQTDLENLKRGLLAGAIRVKTRLRRS